jgi:hypothetical protein
MLVHVLLRIVVLPAKQEGNSENLREKANSIQYVDEPGVSVSVWSIVMCRDYFVELG